MNIDIKKLRPDAKIPVRAFASDAGADVFYCGDDIVTLPPNETCVIGTGLQIATPYGFVTEVKNRSSIASKQSLLVGACVIDSGYKGELKINLHNVGKTTRTINPGDKIAQIVIYRVELPEFEELPELRPLYYRTPTLSSRELGGFGSTNDKFSE